MRHAVRSYFESRGLWIYLCHAALLGFLAGSCLTFLLDRLS
jgi:hypothetical protein